MAAGVEGDIQAGGRARAIVVFVWLWDADGPLRTGRGVSGDEKGARRAAAAFLAAGHAKAARIEQAVAVIGVTALTDGYQRTGNGWQASASGEAVTWEPLAGGAG